MVRAYSEYYKNCLETSLITKDEEYELAKKAKEGNREARDALVIANIRFVAKIAQIYQIEGVSIEDRVGSGNIGLMKAIDRYDPEKGIRLLTYAGWWIKEEIRNSIYKKDARREIRSQKKALLKEADKRETSLEEVIREEREKESSFDYQPGFQGTTQSLDKTIYGDEGTTLYDLISCNSKNPEDVAIEKDTRYRLSVRAREILEKLDERSQKILQMYLGMHKGENPLNLAQIGNLMGLTRERIRQLKEEALSKLKEHLDESDKDLIQ